MRPFCVFVIRPCCTDATIWNDADRLSVFSTENNPKYSNTDSEKKTQIKQIQAWHKTSSQISGCIKLKTNYQLNLPWNRYKIIAGPLVALM